MSSTIESPLASAEIESLSTEIIYAVAAHERVDPMALDPPLFEAIDLDALEALFAQAGNGADAAITSVVFSYNGYDVHVSASGGVQITDSDET